MRRFKLTVRGGFNFTPSNLDPSEGFNTPPANAFRSRNLGSPAFAFLRPMNADQRMDTTYWGVNAELNWNTSIGKLTIIPAYRESEDNSFFYAPAFNTPNTNDKINQTNLQARPPGTAGNLL